MEQGDNTQINKHMQFCISFIALWL